MTDARFGTGPRLPCHKDLRPVKRTMMKKTTLIVALLALSGCATSATSTPKMQQRQIQATQDFVAAEELTAVGTVRLKGQLSFSVVNERFVTVPGRGGTYLVEFYRDCRSLVDIAVAPGSDTRGGTSLNLNVLRASSDTIRGCRIKKIYEITEAQKEELHALGDEINASTEI